MIKKKKTRNESVFAMDDLPEDTMERVTHKTQDKGRIIQRKSAYGLFLM